MLVLIEAIFGVGSLDQGTLFVGSLSNVKILVYGGLVAGCVGLLFEVAFGSLSHFVEERFYV